MAVTVLRTDGWMPQTAALDPALLMYIRTCARTRTCYPNVPIAIDRCVTPSALTVLSAKSDGLDGQDASRSLSVDGEVVPGGE